MVFGQQISRDYIGIRICGKPSGTGVWICFVPCSMQARVEHVSEQTSQLLRDSGGVTWGVFPFFFEEFFVKEKKKKKQKKQNHSSSSNALCGLELYMQKCECFALSTCPDTLLQLHHCAVTHAATEISSHYLPLFTLRPDDSSRPKTLREW